MDYWQTHGILFLLGCTFLPRITLLFFSAVSFGFFTIVGWLFAPHLTVAIIATMLYWDTNPILVIMAWVIAFVGSFFETKVVTGLNEQRGA